MDFRYLTKKIELITMTKKYTIVKTISKYNIPAPIRKPQIPTTDIPTKPFKKNVKVRIIIIRILMICSYR
jgi:hypothetical protein